MELVPVIDVDDDSTLSWAQLLGLCLCWLCCCGAGMAIWRCGLMMRARFFTTWLELAPKKKEEDQQDKGLPTLVRDQGCQTEGGTSDVSSPRTGRLGTQPKPSVMDTPRRGHQKDILLDMARRAQPVIREVEARKHWSVQNSWLEAQGETC